MHCGEKTFATQTTEHTAHLEPTLLACLEQEGAYSGIFRSSSCCFLMQAVDLLQYDLGVFGLHLILLFTFNIVRICSGFRQSSNMVCVF